MFKTLYARRTFGALGLALSLLQATQASAIQVNTRAKSGQATLIGHLYSCSSHVPGGDGGNTVEHGSVTLKDVQINQCGNPNEPAREVWYTSAAGFKGTDTVRFPMGKRGNFGVVYNVNVQ
jgi:hypothetical protein